MLAANREEVTVRAHLHRWGAGFFCKGAAGLQQLTQTRGTKMLELGKYKKTQYSGCNCVQVALLPGGSVGVNNSRTEMEPNVYTADEWKAFVRGVKDGEFDYPGI
jgi:hypothetical protein